MKHRWKAEALDVFGTAPARRFRFKFFACSWARRQLKPHNGILTTRVEPIKVRMWGLTPGEIIEVDPRWPRRAWIQEVPDDARPHDFATLGEAIRATEDMIRLGVF